MEAPTGAQGAKLSARDVTIYYWLEWVAIFRNLVFYAGFLGCLCIGEGLFV